MKRLISLLILLQLVISTEIMSQSPEKDFVVVGMVSGDMSMTQIQMRYEGARNAFIIRDSSINGFEQISNALDGLKVNDLHIFARSNGQDLVLTGLPVTIENVKDLSYSLKRWKNSVSGKVVVHTGSNTASHEMIDLLNKMRELTGLEFKQLR